jgi:NMD protein affecting ribosome stability and mRNA decay
MFCIKCGREAFKDNMCEKCFLEKKELFSLKKIKLRYCNNCRKFYTQSEKIDATALETFLLNQIKAKNSIKKSGIKISARPDKICGTITAAGFVRPSKKLITDKKEFVIYPRRMKCSNCVKMLGNYHEAVIQIRGDAKEMIMKNVEKLIGKEDFANLAALKEGYDVRVIRKAAAAKAVQILQEKYKIKKSFKLVGEKKGRKIYRNFYSVR